MERVVSAYAWLQALLVVLNPLARSQSVLAGNALLLVLLTAAAGGAWASIAVLGYVLVLPFVLAFDHAAHTLAPWPAPSGPVAKGVFRATARLVLPTLVVMVPFLVHAAATSRGLAGGAVMRDLRADPEELNADFRRLVLLNLMILPLLFFLVRLLRAGKGTGEAGVPELLDGTATAEEVLPAVPEPPEPDGTARGRIVAAYLRVVSALVARGFRRRPAHTPRVIAGEAAASSTALSELTATFMDARYGPGEPREDEAHAAERHARELVRLIAGRPRAATRRTS
jgi:hypothetical protein